MVDCTPRRFLVNNSDTGLPHAPLYPFIVTYYFSSRRTWWELMMTFKVGLTAHRLRIKSITKEEKQTVTSWIHDKFVMIIFNIRFYEGTKFFSLSRAPRNTTNLAYPKDNLPSVTGARRKFVWRSAWFYTTQNVLHYVCVCVSIDHKI